MKLDDFDEKFTPSPAWESIHKETMKSYIANKLREFGEKLKKDNLDNSDKRQEYLAASIEGWNSRSQTLNAQIDKELKELE